MTHPYREELAGRLDKARMGTPYRKRGCRFSSYAVDERDLEAAAAALRQSPTVEEVAKTVGLELRRQLGHSFRHMSFDGPTQEMGFSAPSRSDVSIRLQPIAQAIADLYGRGG